jgi:hypothetical protein
MSFPLILLPILVPLITGTILLLVIRVKPDFGYFWISSVLTGLAVWGGLLALRWFTPQYFSMNLWQEIGFQIEFPYFLLDQYSWPYAFSLSSVLTAALITAPVRIGRGSYPGSWAASLILTGLFLAAVLAANPLTLVLSWTAMDLIELVYTLRRGGAGGGNRRAVIAFAIGAAGTYLAVWAMFESQSIGLPLSFNLLTPETSQFLAIAAGVRLAVFPILPYYRLEGPASAGLGSLLKFASPAASLVLLSRLPAVSFTPELSPVLFSLTVLACLYGAAKWLVSRDEICGRSYWIMSLSALAIACLMQGRPDVSPVWGSAMILGGGLLSLTTTRQVRLLFIPLITFLCLTGMIFTPTSAGWVGIWMEPFRLSNAAFLAGYSLLLAGFVKHTIRQDESGEEIDRWVQIIYPAGLINLTITFVLIGVWAVAQYGIHAFWIPPVFSITLALFWLGLRAWLSREKPVQSLVKSTGVVVGGVIEKIVDFKWLFRTIEQFYVLSRQFVDWLTGILEGDGGVLWALLLLMLLITVIRPEVLP